MVISESKDINQDVERNRKQLMFSEPKPSLNHSFCKALILNLNRSVIISMVPLVPQIHSERLAILTAYVVLCGLCLISKTRILKIKSAAKILFCMNAGKQKQIKVCCEDILCYLPLLISFKTYNFLRKLERVYL